MPIPPDIAGLFDILVWVLLLFAIIIIGVIIAEHLITSLRKTTASTISSNTDRRDQEIFRELLQEIRDLKQEIRTLKEELRD